MCHRNELASPCLKNIWCKTTPPHPVLRSVTRRQFVESSPTRPFRTTLHSKGRNSGEIRCSATSGDMLFILSTLRNLWRYSNNLCKCLMLLKVKLLREHSKNIYRKPRGHVLHYVNDTNILSCHFLVSWKFLSYVLAQMFWKKYFPTRRIGGLTVSLSISVFREITWF